MHSREARRQARRIRTRMAVPRLLLAGDADEVLAGLRRDAEEFGIELLPAAGEPDADEPTVVVVAVWILPNQSALTRGLRALEQLEPRLGT
ncbi:MAG: hypothetical protein Q7T71_09535, partial [Herbiconiux sp.]|nr:hypothetical protein [Herbiconiux sp.]